MGDEAREPPSTGAVSGRGGPVDAELRTFLIADVRGYTAFTQRHGDEMAAKLAAKFARVSREVVEAHQGSVLELRGDEALCVFVSPRQAVRAAVALQRRYVAESIDDAELPLPVGIGIDVGEAVPVESGYRSGALNLAARLCSVARPGEILATGELTHIARRLDGLSYVAKDQVRLKGFTEPVRPVRVVPDREDPVAQLVALGAVPSQLHAGRGWIPPPFRARPWLALVIVAGLVVTGAVTGTVAATHGSGTLRVLREDVVGAVDVGSGRVTDQVGVGRDPTAVLVAYGAVWTANLEDGTVSRIDPAGGRVTATVSVGDSPSGLAAGGGGVWVSSSDASTVTRLDAASARVTQTVSVGNGPSALAYAAGVLWVVDTTGNAVYRVDTERNTAELVTRVVGSPTSLAEHNGDLWVSSSTTATVVEVDEHTGQTLQTVHVGNDPRGLAVIGDSVWVANNLDATVSRISASTATVTATLPVGAGPVAVAGDAGAIWVAAADARSVTRIDPRHNRVVTSVSTGSAPAALALAGHRLWMAVGSNPALHRGGTLTVSVPGTLVIDPARGYDPTSEELLESSYESLLALRRAPGPPAPSSCPTSPSRSLPSAATAARTSSGCARASGGRPASP